MIQVIPAIIAKDFEELQAKVKKVEPYVDWVQLDVMDGQFVENSTWNNPKELMAALGFTEDSPQIEAHLMIQNPEEHIDDWIESGVKRIIVHFESTDQPRELINKIKQAGLETGLAINPETSIKVVNDFIEQIDLILVMTVHPGKGGQEFLEETLGKIKDLRQKYKDFNIEVDGGINLETAPKVIQAGANILVSGSAVFESDDIEKTIQELKK